MVLDLFGPSRKRIDKTTKDLLYTKQGGRCMYCGRKMSMAYLHVDHKNPVVRNGSNNPSNLQLLCEPCNTRKGDMTDGQFRRTYGLEPAREAKGPPAKVIPQSYFEKISKELAAKRAKQRRKNNDLWGW